MQQAAKVLKYDVVIAGAGPAGCAAALALKDSGLRVAILDKTTFPRDKVCGDAIPGRAIKTLKNIDPAFEQAFQQFPHKYATRKTALFYKGREVSFNWVREAFTCTRMEFDNFLFNLVKERTGTDIYTDTAVSSAVRSKKGFTVQLKDSDTTFECRMLIGADGAQSALAKQLAAKTMNREHHVGSVRAYYANVGGIDNNTTEIYFDKRFLPSYLWVFPLPGNMANVGFGMLSSEIAKRKINLKKVFHEFIDHIPELKTRFKDAVMQGQLEGFGLPLGSDIGIISGDHFILAGDAASLIDPISGDGIGNAMLSGRLAGLQTISCFEQNNFSAAFIKNYDSRLHAAIGAELQTHYRAQRIMSRYPALLDAVFLACRVPALKRVIQKGL